MNHYKLSPLLLLLLATCTHSGPPASRPCQPGQELCGEDTSYEVVLVIVLVERVPGSYHPPNSNWQPPLTSKPTVLPVMRRVGDCPNWDEALALARERACCGVDPTHPNHGDRTCPCQQAAPCDLCLFLNDDRPPEMYITDMADKAGVFPTDTAAFKRSLSNWRTQVGFLNADLCQGRDNVQELASTLLHESSHLCASINYQKAADAFGHVTSNSDECRAYAVEYKCGFKPKIARETQCFFITK